MRSSTALAQRFRESGRKVTSQRLAVFDALHDGPAHATAEQVHRAVVAEMPNVSLKTVYQTLHELTELGELVAIDLGTGATRFDANLHDHHHFVCESCGQVVDVPSTLTDVRVEVDDLGLDVTHADVVLRGRCSSCATAPTADA